jgi:DNA-binding transcriptional ArsR family regulator
MDVTGLTLFGRARYLVLASMFDLRRGEAIHLREIARRTSLSPTAVQYELRLLVQAGLVTRDDTSGRTVYQSNAAHPITGELRAIIGKTGAHAMSGVTVTDDAHWARKRVQQAADHGAADLAVKSPFLADRKLAQACKVDFLSGR